MVEPPLLIGVHSRGESLFLNGTQVFLDKKGLAGSDMRWVLQALIYVIVGVQDSTCQCGVLQRVRRICGSPSIYPPGFPTLLCGCR